MAQLLGEGAATEVRLSTRKISPTTPSGRLDFDSFGPGAQIILVRYKQVGPVGEPKDQLVDSGGGCLDLEPGVEPDY
jgi:hypothetical protein